MDNDDVIVYDNFMSILNQEANEIQNNDYFNNFSIKKMTKEDVFAVFEIEKELLGTNNITTITSSLDSETLAYYLLIDKAENQIAGFMEVSIIGIDCELYDIAVRKIYQGKHLSNLLMKFLIELCLEKKCETIFLEVNNINSKAINLYKKFGFAKYSIRKNYYGKFDAILMKKEL